MLSCQKLHLNTFYTLLKHNANIHLKNKLDLDALIYSSLNIDQDHTSIKFLMELIKRKANINTCDKNGITPLMIACSANNTEHINMLLKEDVNILQTNLKGNNSLLIAIKNNHLTSIKLLIQYIKRRATNDDYLSLIRHKNHQDINAIIMSIKYDYADIFQYLKNVINNDLESMKNLYPLAQQYHAKKL